MHIFVNRKNPSTKGICGTKGTSTLASPWEAAGETCIKTTSSDKHIKTTPCDFVIALKRVHILVQRRLKTKQKKNFKTKSTLT
jgi:ubiquitin C-terminal hydrolase